jgi:hypothetical protein
MKNFKKILPLTLLSLLVIAGCSREVGTKVPTSVTVSNGAAQEQPATAAQGQAGVPVSRYGTNMKCSLLKSPEGRQECEMQLNDTIGNMLESEIISAFDVDRCKELPTEIAKTCIDRLTATGVKGPVTAEEIALLNEIRRGAPSADAENPVIVYDSARCAELKTVGYKEYCEKMILERTEQEKFSEIMQSEDKARCNELTTVSLKNDCKRFFGEVVEEPVVEAPVAEAPVSEAPTEGALNVPEETPIQ